jgi:predicted amidohydrolase YtcJ
MNHWHSAEKILYTGAQIYSPVAPFATAMLIDGPTIAWLGDDSAAHSYRDIADHVVDAHGTFIAPGFVDAHVHATSTGLVLQGLDLSGFRRRNDVLAELQRWAQRSSGRAIFGHGWDETQWDDPRPLDRTEIDRATWGSVVFLSRIDVHSASISSALLAHVPNISQLSGYSQNGLVSQQAHHKAREVALTWISPAARTDAHRAFRQHAASLGIVAVHEMAGPVISSVSDLQALVELDAHEPGPLVTGYWGELARDGGVATAQQVGAIGAGGDLFVDGSLGSHTACLSDPYTDRPENYGVAYLTAEEVSDHVVAATRAHMQAGFHVIGDEAMNIVVSGFQLAGTHVDKSTLRRARHRLEHAEMMSGTHRAALAEFGVTLSMQPVFDALWGGADGMYAQRLGVSRSAELNPLAQVMKDGLLLAFGSDAPVTPMGGWGAVKAAQEHHTTDSRISSRAAFHAHTRGGWRAVGNDEAGIIAPGAPAHLAIWDVEDVDTHAADERVSRWSTDPRSGTPGLPTLTGGVPNCVRTIIHGRVVHDVGVFA